MSEDVANKELRFGNFTFKDIAPEVLIDAANKGRRSFFFSYLSFYKNKLRGIIK